MLALEKITEKDVVIAKIYKDEKSDEVVEEVWYTPKFSGDSEIVNDDVFALLREEQLTIMKDHNITLKEYTRLCDDVKKTQPVNPDYPRNMKKAFLTMQELVGHKLKRELVIPRLDSEWIRYNYDTSKPNTNNFMLYCGASGSGKTFSLVRATLLDPFLYHYSKFTLIGTTGEHDPSYEPLREYFGSRWEYINSEDITAEQCHIDYYPRNSCVCFDDTTSTVDRRRRAMVQELSDRMLTTARHRSIRVITVYHRFNSYRTTSKARNSSASIHIFPRTIPQTFLQLLEKNFGWKKNKREAMLRLAQQDGRMSVFKMTHPMALITAKRIVLL